MRLYHRSTDQRVRIHCRSMRPNRSKKQSCLSLTSLSVKRDASNLTFTRVSQSGKLVDRWATLRFPIYESLSYLLVYARKYLNLPSCTELVIFFCSFLALRSQDNGPNQVRLITDDELRGEKLLFSGYKTHDLHFLNFLELTSPQRHHRRRLRAPTENTERSRLGGHPPPSIRLEERTQEVKHLPSVTKKYPSKHG